MDVDGIFSLHNCFSDDDCNSLMNFISSKEVIASVIKSRKYESAVDPDAIDYSVFKLVLDAAANSLSSINQAITGCGRVPQSWKTSHTKLIFKKGDPQSPSNWRPISISNAIYRIFSCLWAKAINLFNNNLNIFSPNQTGFISNVNGCSDNVAIISELFCDARRRNKSIVITALDFTNAFGFVPHKMIFITLHAKGFPARFIEIIRSVYTDSTTKIVTTRYSLSDIDIKKGSKQECPISQLLFNL